MSVTFTQPYDIGLCKELQEYSFNSIATPDENTTIISYSMSDNPSGLSINSGIISGVLGDFSKNDNTSSKKDNKDITIGGDNWDNNGRFPNDSFDFIFTVTCNWSEYDEESESTSFGSTTKTYKLTLKKLYDIDNDIWLKKYKYPKIKNFVEPPRKAI